MIQIDELHITMPGSDKEMGKELGQLVSEKLASSLPENYSNHHIPEIRLQMQGSLSTDTSLIADRIAEQIIRQIKLSSL